MKQKIVIKVSLLSEKSRSKAMELVAKANGVTSMAIGDGKDRLEVVGVDVDAVRLVTCLRKKLGYADIVTVEVEEPKDKPEETTDTRIVDLSYYCNCNSGYSYYCHRHNS